MEFIYRLNLLELLDHVNTDEAKCYNTEDSPDAIPIGT